MRRFFVYAAMGMLLPAVGVSAQQQPPTLGPAAPSLNGPKTSTTTDAHRLMQVKAIFIEPVDNDLSGRLMAGLAKMSWAHVVDKPSEADAILRGTCFDSRRLRRLHSEVFISDRASGASIWQDVVRIRVYPPALPKAVAETATQILSDLRESLQEAGK